jgi:hypothetical protein
MNVVFEDSVLTLRVGDGVVESGERIRGGASRLLPTSLRVFVNYTPALVRCRRRFLLNLAPLLSLLFRRIDLPAKFVDNVPLDGLEISILDERRVPHPRKFERCEDVEELSSDKIIGEGDVE